jgi:Zn-dependent protease
VAYRYGRTISAVEPPSVSFRLFRIPVRIGAMALLVPAFGSYADKNPITASIWIALVVLSVLWHELGHSLAMRAFGYQPSIVLHGLGGLACWPRGASPNVRQRLSVTLCGPGAGLLLGLAVWLAARGAALPPLARVAVRDALWINVIWSLINLLPVIPWDGGKLLDELAEIFTGAREPRWVGLVSLAVGAGGAWWAASNGMPFAALFGVVGAIAGWGRYTRSGVDRTILGPLG